MHKFYVIALALAGMWGAGAQESAPDPAVVELRETISKIVDAQSQASRERSDWQERKAEMEALLDLHRRELALLNEELDQAGQSAGGHDGDKQAAQAEIEALRATRRVASEAAARNAPRMLALAARFPAPLAAESEAERLNLEAWQPGDEPREAIQAILGLITKAEQFNRRVTRSREIRENREVDVLYLGLARAYYAGAPGQAGIGEPGPDGWTWTARPEIRGEVVNAFETLDRRRPPVLVELPVQIN
jgi:hypothetical protein